MEGRAEESNFEDVAPAVKMWPGDPPGVEDVAPSVPA